MGENGRNYIYGFVEEFTVLIGMAPIHSMLSYLLHPLLFQASNNIAPKMLTSTQEVLHVQRKNRFPILFVIFWFFCVRLSIYPG